MTDTIKNDDKISQPTGIPYPGGKGNLYQRLINLIPPHHTYIEPFAGGGAVARMKREAVVNIAIDADTEALETLRSAILVDRPAENGDATRWEFLNLDAIAWLQDYPWRGDEFLYCDPPYLIGTRKQQRRLYRYEMTRAHHCRLLLILTRLPCPVMISGYYSDLYAEALQGWCVQTFEVLTRGGSPATEYVWMNYPAPVALHDYSYLGDGFRERERIKRKKARWVKKLQGLPVLERQAILAAITEMNG
jgi:DNA adenine methylase